MNNSAFTGEITLSDFIKLLRESWLTLTLVTTGFAAAAVCAVIWAPRKYEASVVVIPASDQSGNERLASVSSQLGGLASLAGLSPSSSSTKKAETVAILQSEQLTEKYIETNNLLPILYPKLWDSNQRRWKTGATSATPTLWKANRYFKNSIRRVTEDSKTGLITVAITWNDPKTAARWANDIVKETNVYMRDKAIAESQARIAYLNDQAAKASIVEIKLSVYALLQAEIKNVMMARGSDEYALRVVDPAFVPEKPSFPIPSLWIALGTLGGLLFSIVVVLLKADWRQQNSQSSELSKAAALRTPADSRAK